MKNVRGVAKPVMGQSKQDEGGISNNPTLPHIESKMDYGVRIASSLGMKKKKNGYYQTWWGWKSGEGIVEIIRDVAEQIEKDFPREDI